MVAGVTRCWVVALLVGMAAGGGVDACAAAERLASIADVLALPIADLDRD